MFLETNDKSDFDKAIATAGDALVVVDFFATWCGPCRIMGPKFYKLSEEFPKGVFIKVDVDEADDILAKYKIKVMPTFVFIKKGKIIHTFEGNNSDGLKAAVKERI